MNLLIIEDDHRLASTIGDVLQSVGLCVEYCHDGDKGLEKGLLGTYALIVLDVMLPGRNGYDVARELRRNHNETPILMLTAKSEVSDRVEGLNSGADYYLTKPFHAEELISCVHALLRRQGIETGSLTYANTTLELKTALLNCGVSSIRLSEKEFQIMELLLKGKERTIPKEHILTTVWGHDAQAMEHHVEVYVSMLRKKLKVIGSHLVIEAVSPTQYQLAVNEND